MNTEYTFHALAPVNGIPVFPRHGILKFPTLLR
jgi:hypothetical protein